MEELISSFLRYPGYSLFISLEHDDILCRSALH